MKSAMNSMKRFAMASVLGGSTLFAMPMVGGGCNEVLDSFMQGVKLGYEAETGTPFFGNASAAGGQWSDEEDCDCGDGYGESDEGYGFASEPFWF